MAWILVIVAVGVYLLVVVVLVNLVKHKIWEEIENLPSSAERQDPNHNHIFCVHFVSLLTHHQKESINLEIQSHGNFTNEVDYKRKI